jgi:DNA polymerase-1
MEYTVVSSLDELYLTTFYEDLKKADAIGLDTESSGLDYFNDTLLLVQLEINDNIYVLDTVGLGHDALNHIVQDVKSSNVQCIAHNAKYDIEVIRANTNIKLENTYCTMVSESVIDAGLEPFYLPLSEVTLNYLGIELDKLLRDQFIGATVVVKEQLDYAAEDVAYLRAIRDAQIVKLSHRNLVKTANLENDLTPVVASMEYEGVALDEELWMELTNKATEAMESLRTEVLNLLFDAVEDRIKEQESALEGCALLNVTHKKTKKMIAHLEGITEPDYILSTVRELFNLGSWRQLLALLNLYGIPTTSTNMKILEQFKPDYPELLGVLFDYKEHAKLVSSFGKEYVQRINPATGRLHANANQLGARSGRWSYSKPNLQQVPKDDSKKGNMYRQCFIARPDHKILTVDYDQAELRLLGAVAGEPEFIEAYQNGIDIHKLTATKIYDKELEDIIDIERWTAKQINFAIVYGSTAYGLEFNFNIPLKEGERHLNNYYRAYPYIKSFMDMAGDKIWDIGYTITPFGRKRFFEKKSFFKDIYEANRYKNKIKRQGINTIIQGGSADILKLALVDIYYNNPFGDLLKILMTIHDEGVYEVHNSVVDEATEFVVECMERNEQGFLGEIPAKVDYKIADTWSK